MKNVFFVCLFVGIVFSSEDSLQERYPKKQLELTKDQRMILEESQRRDKTREKKQKKQESIKGSVVFDNPYAGIKNDEKVQSETKKRILNRNWIYGTAVITTTFLNGSIKRSYGVLLRDGLYVTSANMVYNQNVYARSSYAMMQDDSSLPFICVAKLSIKALDLERGLAILETLDFTDIYCNIRERAYYQERIYSNYWVNMFNGEDSKNYGIVYSPYITPLNSFAVEEHILNEETLEIIAKKETEDFEGYKYAYGKGFYNSKGKFLGLVAASDDNNPKFVKAKEIADFLCELKNRKILSNDYLQRVCPAPPKK